MDTKHSYKLLDRINSPADLRSLPEKDMPALCEELRDFMVNCVSRTGGHLGSNLGVTELSVALHRVFDSPHDHIIFDVGHQSYVHKILTGRKDRFDQLRVPGGLSGFTLMRESPHDAFGAGHSSTSLSAALGYAEADCLAGRDSYTVCVIGDGAYTGGMIHEALNNCRPDLRLIIILNENRMSISPNRGAFASHISRIRISAGYRRWKENTNFFLSHVPLLGKPLRSFLTWTKEGIKKHVYQQNYFEQLGLYYVGPVNGNNYAAVARALAEAKSTGKCCIVHAFTKKGKGYEPAERSPDGFHSVTAAADGGETFHSRFASRLSELARTDASVVAVTAAMGIGTGLDAFGKEFPKRYFDVGIAEAHALTFSAGLAAAGLRPYAAIYSTFLQRGYDSILHDIALQHLPVHMMIDRAGLALHDGATHHGIFDVSFLSSIPGIAVYAPATFGSLDAVLTATAAADGPVAVRYPNSGEDPAVRSAFYPEGDYTLRGVRAAHTFPAGAENVLITYGGMASRVLRAAELLREAGRAVSVLLLEQLAPYDDTAERVAPLLRGARHIVFAEEGICNGGAGMILLSRLEERGILDGVRYEVAAVRDNFAAPGTLCDLYEYVGLSPRALAERFLGK